VPPILVVIMNPYLAGPVDLGSYSGLTRDPDTPVVLPGLVLRHLKPPGLGEECRGGYYHAVTLELLYRKQSVMGYSM
jgi:hypothetical protein